MSTITPVYTCWVADHYISENRVWRWLHDHGQNTVDWKARGINSNYSRGDVWDIVFYNETIAALFKLTFADGMLFYDQIIQ